jgi:hypothetical protein
VIIALGIVIYTLIYFGIWYGLTMFTWVMNGGRDTWDAPFRCYYRDIRCNLPFGIGQRVRLEYANGDAELAAMYPSLKYMLLDLLFWVAMYFLWPVAVFAWALARCIVDVVRWFQERKKVYVLYDFKYHGPKEVVAISRSDYKISDLYRIKSIELQNYNYYMQEYEAGRITEQPIKPCKYDRYVIEVEKYL